MLNCQIIPIGAHPKLCHLNGRMALCLKYIWLKFHYYNYFFKINILLISTFSIKPTFPSPDELQNFMITMQCTMIGSVAGQASLVLRVHLKDKSQF